ncbi:acyl-CoA dehydrogenase family protein [bacterium]|nr:acyl-CoA dehydrogenase family protein [bacterium]
MVLLTNIQWSFGIAILGPLEFLKAEQEFKMIHPLLPNQLQKTQETMRMAAEFILRPISRKYDKAEHEPPVEMEQLNQAAAAQKESTVGDDSVKSMDLKGRNLWAVISLEQMCWGDVGLFLARPGTGLGNAAIMAVGNPDQKSQWGKRWASMAITEPAAGSDSKNISTTAVLDGDEWVINGEKIYVTDGDRCDCVVVWATLNKALGKTAIRSFIVEKGTPGFSVARLEKKLGIRASDTATLIFDNCRIPRENLLGGKEEVETDIDAAKKSFGGAMQTFDNTRPMVAGMAIGLGQAALDMTKALLAEEGYEDSYGTSMGQQTAIQYELEMLEAELEAARLLVYKSSWMMDNKMPNSKEASMGKAKAGRIGNKISLKCVEICSMQGFSEDHLLEKGCSVL